MWRRDRRHSKRGRRAARRHRSSSVCLRSRSSRRRPPRWRRQVDALYFFLVARQRVLRRAHLGAGRRTSRIKYRRRAADEVGVPIHGVARARARPGRSSRSSSSLVMFVWGASVFFAHGPAAGRDAGRLRRRQAVDVEVPAPRRASARSTSCTCPVGRAGQADDDLRGRHPRLLRPGVPREGGRLPGPLHARCGSRPPSPGAYHLFCAEYCGTKHSGMIGWVIVMEPADYQAWLAGGAGEGSLAQHGREAVQGPRLRHLPPGGRAGPRPVAARASSAATVHAGRRPARSTADEAYLRESIVNPQREDGGGLPADHADVPGPGQRGRAAAAHRVHQVAEGRAVERDGRAGAPPRTAAARDTAPRRSRPWTPPTLPHELPERRLRPEVVAADDRPQADRAAVPDQRSPFFFLSAASSPALHPPRAADAAPATWSSPTPTTSCSRCTASSWSSSS